MKKPWSDGVKEYSWFGLGQSSDFAETGRLFLRHSIAPLLQYSITTSYLLRYA